MPTTVNLSVGSGEIKNLTFNCGDTFVPDDIQFVITGSGGDTNTDYVIQCDTAAGTRLKSGTSVTSYTPTVGIHLIHIKNANTYTSAGLYGQFNGVPSSTTSVIYINGSASSTSNRTLPAGLYAAYYDGTRWHFRTDGKIDFGGTGFLKANGGVDTNTYLTAVSSVSAAPAASLSGTTLTFKQLSQTTAAQVSWTDSTTTLTFNTAPSASNNIATMTDVNNAFQVNDAMVYKGTLGTGGTVTALPATHNQGWTYKVITAGTYAGQTCEIGDMIICITDGTSANNAHWTVVQSNIDGAVIGPSSSTANHIATFDGTTGKLIKDSGYTIGTSVPSNAVFTDEKVTPVVLATTGTTNYNILLANNSGTPTTNGKPNYATAAKINGKGEITASKIITNSSSTDMLLANGNTLPQSTFATSGHNHSVSLASGGTSTVNLAANTAYTLTVGGSSIVFKTPSDNNNNTVTTGKSGVVLSTTGVAVVQQDGTDSGTVALPSSIPSSWLGTSGTTASAGNHTHSNYLTSYRDYVIYSSTVAGTQIKTGTSNTSFTPVSGGTYLVHITTTNTYNGAIKFQGNGVPYTAQTIYINGTVSDSSNHTLPSGLYEAYYNGTTWYFRTDGKRQSGGFVVPGSTGFLKADGSIDNTAYTTNTGTVTSVNVGSTTYNPSNGVVSLPAYPTVPSAGTSASAVTNGSASGGSATTYSKSDHVHNITSAAIIGALGFTPSSSEHTHTTSIATSTGTNQITLGYGSKYSLTAGGTSYVFTMPGLGTSGTTAAAGNHTHSGYLTSHQTIKVDGVTGATTSHYGTCGTAASTTAKAVTVTGTPNLEAGLRVIVKFTTTNSASSPTLNVNNTGAKSIYYRGSAITSSNNNILQANRVYEFVYDGTNWLLVGDIDTNSGGTVTSVGLSSATDSGITISGSPITSSGTILVRHTNALSNAQPTQAVYPITIDKNGHIASYGTSVTIPTISGTNDGTNWTSLTINGTTKNIPLGGDGSSNSYSGIAYCNTAANTNEKYATYPNFSLQDGQRIILYLEVGNSVSNGSGCTLNVNGTGAKVIKMETYNGSGVWGNVWGPQPAKGYYLCEYDNVNWKLTKINISDSIGICMSASNSSKSVDIEGFALHNGSTILLGLTNDNTLANATLNVGYTGPKPIKIGGSSTTSSNLKSGLYICDFDGTNWNFKKAISENDGTIIISDSSESTTPQNVSQSVNLLYLNYVQNGVVNGSIGIQGVGSTSVSSTIVNGTNQQIIRIIGDSSGSGGGASYLNDLNDVYTSDGHTNEVLGYNGSTWTGMYVAKTVTAGSGLNTTSGDTTSDGGYIGDSGNGGIPTGTIHLTRVNNTSSYNGSAKPGFGPAANKTVTSLNNTFDVPYYQVDKFGRVTGSATRTITINGLGGGGGGSSVCVGAGESMNLGYKAGKVNVNNVETNFIVPPARSFLSGGSQYDYTAQGLVRPRFEYDMTYNSYSEGDSNDLSNGLSKNTDLEHLVIFTDAPDPGEATVALIPIVTVYYTNAISGRNEAMPFLALDYEIADKIGLFKGYDKSFSPKKPKM